VSMGIHSVGTSDAALVRRVQAGDTGAYADLVARYRDRLGRYALHMLGNREDAEPVPHGGRARRAPGSAIRVRPRRPRGRAVARTGRTDRVGRRRPVGAGASSIRVA